MKTTNTFKQKLTIPLPAFKETLKNNKTLDKKTIHDFYKTKEALHQNPSRRLLRAFGCFA